LPKPKGKMVNGHILGFIFSKRFCILVSFWLFFMYKKRKAKEMRKNYAVEEKKKKKIRKKEICRQEKNNKKIKPRRQLFGHMAHLLARCWLISW